MIAVTFPHGLGSFQGHHNIALPVERGVKVNDPGRGCEWITAAGPVVDPERIFDRVVDPLGCIDSGSSYPVSEK